MNNVPKQIIDVRGDGNCFFRCLAQAVSDNEEEHATWREKVVATMQEDITYYKTLMDGDVDEHLESKSKTLGGNEIWATEAEIHAASEYLNLDIFVYSKPSSSCEWQWQRHSRNEVCDHNRKYLKIKHADNHFQVVIDHGRPCGCRRNKHDEKDRQVGADKEESQHSKNQQKDRTQSSHKSSGKTNEGSTQDEEGDIQHSPQDVNSHTPSAVRWNGCGGQELEEVVETAYNEIIHFRHFNMFMPPNGESKKKMLIEMTSLIQEYVDDSPMEHLALKMLMIMPQLLQQKTHIKAKTKENNKAFDRRMNAWKKGEYKQLLAEAQAIQKKLTHKQKANSRIDVARKFRQKMENGLVRQASRLIQKNERGGILLMNEETMLQLQEKHPAGAEATEEALIQCEQPPVHSVTFSGITGDMVRRAAIETSGSAGPSGMDGNTWRSLLTSRRYPNIVADLRTAIAKLTRKTCIEECEYIEPLTASRLIPAKKIPDGIRPIGIGEVLKRIMGRCVMKVVGNDVMKAAGNLQVCAGQQAGAEAAIHSMREIYEGSECDAVLLVDASNAFNTLNRKAMLHNTALICPPIAKFVSNTYQIAPRLIIAEGNEIKSKEGTTQGDPIAMAIYALGLSVIQQKLDMETTGAKHVLFADDMVGAGTLQAVKKLWDAVGEHGPPLGYYPNTNKTCLIVKSEKLEEAKSIFGNTGIRITTEGEKHLGAVIGSEKYKDTFVKNKVEEWVQEVKELSEIAKTEPHSAYTNFIFSTKMRWNYVMRTIPNISQYLQPLEKSIRQDFIPSLLKCNVKQAIRDLIALPARFGGMGIINPVKTADEEYKNSTKLTKTLTERIVEQDKESEVDRDEIKEIKRQISQERATKQRQELERIEKDTTLKKKKGG